MKKKIISLLTAAMLVASMGTTVFAAGSPAAGDITPVVPVTPDKSQTVKVDEVVAKDSKDYEATTGAAATVKNAEGKDVEATVKVKTVSNDTVNTTVEVVKNQLENVEAVADKIGSEELKEAAKDDTKKIVPEIKTIVNIEAEDVEVTEDNKITVTITVPDINAGDNILILHWNGSAWETIKPDSVGKDTVVATFSSLSPIAVVKLTVADADTNGGNGGNGGNGTNGGNGANSGNGSAAGTTTNTTVNKTNNTTVNKTTNTTTTTKTSPKTGWSLL